ncbi:MAG TPA: hypothetical protein GXX55_09415 [Firmicutes bacterium]|nr:hypothetical protein [Bacillota bacterium]
MAHVTPLRNHPFVELVNKLSAQWWMHVFYSTAVLLETDDFGFRIPPEPYVPDRMPELAQQITQLRMEALYLLESEGTSAAESRLAQQESWHGITLIRPAFQPLKAYLVERRRGKYGGLADFIPDLANEMAGW